MKPNCRDEFIHRHSFADVQPARFVETRMKTFLKITDGKAVQFRYVLSRRREQSLAFDKHTSGMSVKKNIIKQQRCIYFFFFSKLQKAAKNCIFIDYSTQFVRQTELLCPAKTSKHKNSSAETEKKQKQRVSPVSVV